MKRLPERGDVVWASMDPAVGREQAKRRPWLVLSERALHRVRGLIIAVPLTHTDRGWVTHVNLTPFGDEPTIAMCEQVKSISTSRITRIDPAPYPNHIVDQVHSVLKLLTEGRR
ncbi:MAG: type II toxin-antitoxin system PemK/MazF family toxin [Propionibacteriaceae bacterium]|nr:type II toxin-antitoxin system PemK/MazF family toxin [Propionibacteriaceae bacterium]